MQGHKQQLQKLKQQQQQKQQQEYDKQQIYCAATAAVAIALYTGSNCCSMLIISLNILFGCRNISSDTSISSSSSSSMRYIYYCAAPTAQAIAMYASSISSTTRSYNIKYLSNNNCIINMNLNYSAVTPTPAIATTYASSNWSTSST